MCKGCGGGGKSWKGRIGCVGGTFGLCQEGGLLFSTSPRGVCKRTTTCVLQRGGRPKIPTHPPWILGVCIQVTWSF